MTNNSTKNSKVQHRNELGYIDPFVAGIDIGDKLIHVSIPNNEGTVNVKEFGTTTPDLRQIAQTLKNAGVKIGVMEATGVYWIPLYEILESEGFKAILVDAKSVKNVPGRKTDVKDCQWIQTLYSNGLLRAAFRPKKDRLKLRAYVRHRLSIIKQKQYALLHIEKALQLMNIKLSTVLSDIAGISGFEIIRTIISGERDPVKLAKLRNKTCKQPEEIFIKALTGNYQEEHIFALKQAVKYYDFSMELLEECDNQIKTELETYPDMTKEPIPERAKDKNKDKRFATAKKPKKNEFSFDARTILWQKSGKDVGAIPGIGEGTALLIFAELGGYDVSSWRSAKEFASWLKLCPGNNISGGKRRKSKKQASFNYIAQALRMSSLTAKKTNTALGAHIRRICGRTDKPKGIKAGAHKLATTVYSLCKENWLYYEAGVEAFEKKQSEKFLKNLHKKAKENGYTLVPLEQSVA